MRCACRVCGTYMVHAEDLALGCVCPDCLNRCDACLGTNTVVPREGLKDVAEALLWQRDHPQAEQPAETSEEIWRGDEDRPCW